MNFFIQNEFYFPILFQVELPDQRVLAVLQMRSKNTDLTILTSVFQVFTWVSHMYQ